VGNETYVKINYAPTAESVPAAAPAASSPAAPAVTPAPAASPVTMPVPLGNSARLSFQPGAVQVPQNAPFTLTVQADDLADAASVTPLQIKYDPAQLRLNDAVAGDLLSRDGVRVNVAKDIRNDTGDATITLSRETGGVSGSGGLVTLSFTAIGRGTGTVNITGASLKNSQSQPLPAMLSSVSVTIQ